MTEITDEGRKLAAELANAEDGTWSWKPIHFGETYAAPNIALARLATKHEKAVADLREIARLLDGNAVSWVPQANAIAAKYCETDPLVEALDAVEAAVNEKPTAWTKREAVNLLRAELSKRGFELARVKP